MEKADGAMAIEAKGKPIKVALQMLFAYAVGRFPKRKDFALEIRM